MPRYYEFEVALREFQPRLWRRLLLRTTASFAQFHKAIQDSFGWKKCHLWESRLPTHQGRPIAGLPGGEEFDRPTPDARQVKRSSYFTGRRGVEGCEYLYDFGDGWTHDVKLVAVHSDHESFKRWLLEGERAAPPEACDGTPGYARMVHYLETREDLYDEDPNELGAWLDGWRPNGFDLARAQEGFDR